MRCFGPGLIAVLTRGPLGAIAVVDVMPARPSQARVRRATGGPGLCAGVGRTSVYGMPYGSACNPSRRPSGVFADGWLRRCGGVAPSVASSSSPLPTQRSPMFSSTAYTIRRATEQDALALRRLPALDSRPALAHPAPRRALAPRVLVGELAGGSAAALSRADGRLAADPFLPTGALAVHLRLRAKGLLAYDREPSLAARIRTALRPVAARRTQIA